ncbi:MAG: helix-turn-helix domain-containing protein [Patescibacteria group bacterium]
MYVKHSPELIKAVKAFGLDTKEAEIYLAGIELGPASVLDLARRTEMARTTLYPILEKLRRLGLFRYAKQKKRSQYIAVPPTALLQLLSEREHTLIEAIPQLEALHGTVHEGAGVTLYEGTDGFKQLWQKIYRSGVKEYRNLTTGVGLLDYVKEPYLVERIIAERLERGIKSYQLIPETTLGKRIVKKDKDEMRESRFLPADAEIPASMLIFGDDVAFITTRAENTMILVASGETARTHKTMFDLLWQCAKKPENLK